MAKIKYLFRSFPQVAVDHLGKDVLVTV